jgi:hypothetical protein
VFGTGEKAKGRWRARRHGKNVRGWRRRITDIRKRAHRQEWSRRQAPPRTKITKEKKRTTHPITRRLAIDPNFTYGEYDSLSRIKQVTIDGHRLCEQPFLREAVLIEMIFICLTIVGFPDSPEPGRGRC